MKRLVTMLLVTMMAIAILLPVSAMAAEKGITCTVVTQVDPLRVRNAPRGNVIGMLPKGSKVEVLEVERTGYAKIRWGSGTAWAFGEYLRYNGAPLQKGKKYTTPVIKTEKVKLNLEVNASLRMRVGPSTSYQVLLVIPKGKVLRATERSNGWYKVTYCGKTGWVSGQYVTVVKK